MNNARRIWRHDLAENRRVLAAIHQRFHTRKIEEVSKVARRKSQIRVAEERVVSGKERRENAWQRERERKDDGGGDDGGYLINN